MRIPTLTTYVCPVYVWYGHAHLELGFLPVTTNLPFGTVPASITYVNKLKRIRPHA
jgi:hypothetical protein